jgi:hypothetical protein
VFKDAKRGESSHLQSSSIDRDDHDDDHPAENSSSESTEPDFTPADLARVK